MLRPCTPVREYSTEDECIELHGVSEGEECPDDIRQASGVVEQVEQGVLGKGLLCGNHR